MGLGALPAPALAADPPDPYVLPRATLMAITADVDGDGAREVVRLTGPGPATQIEAWGLEDDTWAMTMSADLPTRAAPEGSESDPSPAVTMMRTQVVGEDRVLVLTGANDSQTGAAVCCLAMHELIGAGAAAGLQPVAVPEIVGDAAVAADLDGDGTDELLVWSTAWTQDGMSATTSIDVLRRSTGEWVSLGSWQREEPWGASSVVESDGLPGLEILATEQSGELTRLAWIDGALVTDRTRIPARGEPDWVVGAVDGMLLTVTSTSVELVRWSRGGEGTVVATHRTRGYASIGFIGGGEDALLIVQEAVGSGTTRPQTRVLDLRLQVIEEVRSSPEAEALWQMSERFAQSGWGSMRNMWPYFGPANGEWGREATAYRSGGMLVSRDPGGRVQVRPTTAFVSVPVGAVGPGDGWVALADSFFPSGPIAYLQGGYSSAEGRLVLVPEEAMLADGGQRPLVADGLEGGVEMRREGHAVTVLAAPTGVDIVLSVVPGTVAVSWDGVRVDDHGLVDGVLRLSVPPPPRPRPGRVYEFERDLMLIAPDGSASVHRWEGTFALEAPELTSEAELEPLSLQASVIGRAGPGSTVTVDGREVRVSPSGGYRTVVEAPPWPRDVVVVARDPFGTESRMSIQVIGLVDYRGLPWVPMAAVATVVGGGLLFLRTPARRPTAGGPVLDEGQLEELDPDPV